MSSKYTLQVEGVDTDFVRATKSTVVAEADKVRAERKVAVSVVTANGTVVYDVPAPKARKEYAHPKPFTRVVSGPEGILAELDLEGYVLAYDRPVRDAFVARSMTADKDERYAVITNAGGFVGFSDTTRGAGQIMLSLPKVSLAKATA